MTSLIPWSMSGFIPLTEAERAFSALGLYITRLRSRFSDETLENLFILRSYFMSLMSGNKAFEIWNEIMLSLCVTVGALLLVPSYVWEINEFIMSHAAW